MAKTEKDSKGNPIVEKKKENDKKGGKTRKLQPYKREKSNRQKYNE